ncbi:MAG: metallophosphoesterase [Candidatus Nealsonbacteria bacterium]|nr:metallophosphoesterase [Candidatus Nealsonbacteria bacterium]
MDLLLLLLALPGHAFFWVALTNRIHGKGMPHGIGKLLTLPGLTFLALGPVALAWWFIVVGPQPIEESLRSRLPPAAQVYLVACWVAGTITALCWFRRHVLHRPPNVVRSHRSRPLQLNRDAHAPSPDNHDSHFLVRMPGNQILQLDVTELAIDVPRLPAALDGLSIVHLSDFHFTGRIGKSYFQEVVAQANEIEPDLMAVTGDLIDRPQYIDWLPETLGRLRARYGVFFVLGNHDRRADPARIRDVLRRCGLVDLGGRWEQVEIRGEPVVLIGNELPWFPPAADVSNCPKPRDGGPTRIVLSHSPDQFAWARTEDADLLLAGHTHGGQIRFPLIGPIFTPSELGVRYASGVFYNPPTILHVTRGVSGELPVRLNCPPEMAHLMLHAPRKA